MFRTTFFALKFISLKGKSDLKWIFKNDLWGGSFRFQKEPTLVVVYTKVEKSYWSQIGKTSLINYALKPILLLWIKPNHLKTRHFFKIFNYKLKLCRSDIIILFCVNNCSIIVQLLTFRRPSLSGNNRNNNDGLRLITATVIFYPWLTIIFICIAGQNYWPKKVF